MKKIFLTFGLVGALCAINSYADSNQSVVAVYSCPDGCSITSSADMAPVGCVFSDGQTCDGLKVDIFVPQTIGMIINSNQMVRNSQSPVSARAATNQQVTARAAKRTNTIGAKSGGKQSGPDKLHSGSSWIQPACEVGCSWGCKENNICSCWNSAGEDCGIAAIRAGGADMQ